MARKHLNIGGKIQARRKAMGLSQEDLAQLTGVSRQSVTKWETGQSPMGRGKPLSAGKSAERNKDLAYCGMGTGIC